MERGGRLGMDATAAKLVDVQMTDRNGRSGCWELSLWWILAANVGDGAMEVEAAATRPWWLQRLRGAVTAAVTAMKAKSQ